MADKKVFRFEPMVPKELLEPLEWAIEGFMPFNGITCLFGKPGAFKTFEAIDIAACKAAGLSFCGRWVGPPCKVGYIAADAPKGAKLRAKAWVQAHQDILDEHDIDEDVLAANLMVLPMPAKLHKPDEVAEAIRQLKEESYTCEVLIVDTLFHSSIGAKLTQPEEILPLLEQLKLLMEAVGAKACLLVHHTTKDGEEFFGSVSSWPRHTPNTTNGVEVAANIGAIGVQVSVTVAIVRGVIVTPSKTDNRGHTRTIRIAVNAAIVRRSRSTAAPAAPGGFGRNSH